MTISEQIRAAALGRRPWQYGWLYGWLGDCSKAHTAVKLLSDWESPGVTKFTGASDTERRMFLLLCAEALESETA